MNDFVNELCHSVVEEGYYQDFINDQTECLFCGNVELDMSGGGILHDPECIVGRAEKYLRDNTWQ